MPKAAFSAWIDDDKCPVSGYYKYPVYCRSRMRDLCGSSEAEIIEYEQNNESWKFSA